MPNEGSRFRFLNFALGFSLLAAAISIFDIVGWFGDVPLMRTLLPDFPQMVPMSAMVTLGLAVSMLLLSAQGLGARRAWFARSLLFAVIALCAESLGEGLTHSATGMFRFFPPFTDYGRPSPQCCVSAMSLAIALLTYSWGLTRNRHLYFQSYIYLALFLNTLSFVGYLYSGSAAPFAVKYLGLSLPTTLSFTLLAFAALSLDRNHGLFAILIRRDSAGLFLRRFILACTALPIIMAFMIRLGEAEHLYPSSVSMALFVVFTVFGLIFFSLLGAKSIAENEERNMAFERNHLQIAEARRHSQAVEEIRSTMIRALEASQIGYWEWDLRKDLVTWSELQSSLYGFSSHIANPTIEQISAAMHPADHKMARERIYTAIENRMEYDAEFRVVHPNGQIRWLMAKGRTQYGEDGKPYRMTGTNYDITNLKESERQLRQAKEQAETANKLKSAFLANMSHEIRTPLGAILGFLELVNDPSTTPSERSEFSRIIERNGRQLTNLIEDILDLSKVEAGQLKMEVQECSVKDILDDVLLSLSVTAQSKSLQLKYQVKENVPALIGTDPSRLKQILTNIIGNAIKFTPEGSVRIEVEQNSQSAIQIAITDTGIGISERQREDLFQPFMQADPSITRKFGGTGLGLVLSRELARTLGGDLVLRSSQPLRGSCFEIQIANHPVTGKLLTLTSCASEVLHDQAKASPLRDLHVLLVEDSPDNQEFVSRLLTRLGATIEIAENGRLGVERACEGHFDLILMDLQMPVMDGYTATHQLRQIGFRKPIIAFSAHANSDSHQKCLDVGCDGFLNKPIRGMELAEMVARFGP